MARFRARIARSVFMRLLMADPITRRECRSGMTARWIQPSRVQTERMSPAHFWLVWLAAKCCHKSFGAMLTVWSLSVPCRGNDPPDHFLTLLDCEFMGSDPCNGSLPHQTPHPAVPHPQAQLVQLFRHFLAAMAARA